MFDFDEPRADAYICDGGTQDLTIVGYQAAFDNLLVDVSNEPLHIHAMHVYVLLRDPQMDHSSFLWPLSALSSVSLFQYDKRALLTARLVCHVFLASKDALRRQGHEVRDYATGSAANQPLYRDTWSRRRGFPV